MSPPRTSFATRRPSSAKLARLMAALALALAVGASVAPWAARAEAAPSSIDRAKALVREAELKYKLGRFDEALASYTKAYEQHPAAALLFNIGQCHRQLKNYERAVFFFEGFLRETGPGPNRKLATELIAEAERELEEQRQRAAELERQDKARRAQEEAARERQRQEDEARARRAIEQGAPAAAETPAATGTPVMVSGQEGGRDGGPDDSGTPVYRRWWFWAAAGAVVLVAAGVLALSLGGDETVVLPRGSAGTLDRRP